MAEQSAKNKRSQALSNFSRCHNLLTPLLANPDSPSVVVIPMFEKLKVLWEKLEAAQDCYIELVTDIDVDNDPSGVAYIDNAGDRYAESLLAYSEYVNVCKVKESETDLFMVVCDDLLDNWLFLGQYDGVFNLI